MQAPSRTLCRTAALLCALATGACEATDSPDRSGPLSLEASDVHVIGTSEAIAEVVDLSPGPEGSVWVINSVEPFVVGFGPDGEILDEYGTRGGGPTEFAAPSGFVMGGPGDAIWLLDPRRHRMVRVPRTETGQVDRPLPRDSLAPGSVQGGMGFMSPQVRSAALGSEIVVPRSFGTLRSGVYAFWAAVWGADLVAVEQDTGSSRTVLSLAGTLDDPTEYLQQTNGFPPFPLWLRLWGVCGGDEIWVHDRQRNQIRPFSAEGAELATLPLPAPHFESVSNEQFTRAIFALRAAEVAGAVGSRLTPADSTRVFSEIIQNIQGTPEGLARFLPRYVDMRCGDDGSAWLQPLDLDRSNLEGGRLWIRVARDQASREVELPEGFDAYRFQGGRIWGVQRDALDVASVAWITLPSGA